MKEYSLIEKNNNLGFNVRKAHCLTCGIELAKNEGRRVFVADKGIRVVCNAHYGTSGLLPYHGNANLRRNNDIVLGTVKSTPLAQTTIGIELEVEGSSKEVNAIRAYFEHVFVVKAESDCTVSAEFPTEKMRGLGKLSKVLQSLDIHGCLALLDNDSCGAHIHVQCDDIEYIRRYYHSIFKALCDYISNLEQNYRIDIFGRDFATWAHRIDNYSNPLEHANFVNTQHDHTLELRLPRIHSYKQYMKVLKFWRECGCYINQFDFNKTNRDNNKRVAKARECGKGLVEIAKKYF